MEDLSILKQFVMKIYEIIGCVVKKRIRVCASIEREHYWQN